MTQIFGIHTINGLPSNSDTLLSCDIPLIENLSDTLQPPSDTLKPLSSVYIVSDPVGAQIFIDGIEQTGFSTPSMITDIPAGHHNFKIISPGYVDVESSMPLEPGKTYNIYLTMGNAKLASPYIGTPDLMLLFAIGLIGYYLIRNK